MSENERVGRVMPMMPLRGIAVYPGMLMHFDVGRPMSINALDRALETGEPVFLLAQKDLLKEKPGDGDFYKVGTICTVRQLLRGGDGIRVLVEGLSRGKLVEICGEDGYFTAEVMWLEDKTSGMTSRVEALLRQCYEMLEEYADLSPRLTPDLQIGIMASNDPGYIADYIAQNIPLRFEERQKLLEELRPAKRLEMIVQMLGRQTEILGVEQEIRIRVHEQMERSQREHILREQMRILRDELGESDDENELEGYKKRILGLSLSEEITEKLLKEVSRLAKQPSGSSEGAVIRTYLDICLELPWSTMTAERADIKRARQILDDDHFGIDKVKERIVEFIAVKQLSPGLKSPVLCLVGPPGVGKTSIASSIARALDRKMARLSLGGVHDEAEIRGHRKTYVGAMPGRIMSAVKQAGSKNPLLLLDEIDKLGSDYRGDPSAALLEALDTEQNHEFRDHYLELPFDLSNVLFITTANTTDTIPRALLDRMEVIEMGSYTDEEKVQIAKRHLLPKQRAAHGLNGRTLRVSDDAVRAIIDGYTRESGVRILERQLAALCRKAAHRLAEDEVKSVGVSPRDLRSMLGVRKFKPEVNSLRDEVGLVRGLAWTSVGGEVLDVEANIVDGTGKLELTGNLGDVMKESAKAALTYIRSRADRLGIERDFYKTKDIHIHFPEGATPKDGPSAGITIAIALISALTGAPARRHVAMTGEITLRGRILPIGGLKEKTMAAYRNGVKTVIIPLLNEPDLDDIDPAVRGGLSFVPTEHIDNVIELALDLQRPLRLDAPKAEEAADAGLMAQ